MFEIVKMELTLDFKFQDFFHFDLEAVGDVVCIYFCLGGHG